MPTAFLTQSNDFKSKTQNNLSPDQLENQIVLDFHYSKNTIFWTNRKTKSIYSAFLELNQKSLILSSNPQQLPLLSRLKLHKVKPIIENGLKSPDGLCVDWVNNRIFWTDSGFSRIEYSNLDGSGRKVLFKNSIHKPKSIAVNPERSTIYWTDWGDPPRIESAFMDRTNRKVIVDSLLTMPTGLVIDFPASKLYWVDIQQNVIECSELDGSSRYTIVSQQLNHPMSLNIFEDNLYWTSVGSVKVSTVNKLTARNITAFNINDDHLASDDDGDAINLDLKVFHSLRQPEVTKHPCQYHQCSHQCLPNNISYQCSCPFGFSFENDDHQKCHKDTNSLLLFAHRSEIRAVFVSRSKLLPERDFLQNDFSLDYVLPIAHISFVVSFAYDPISSTIYWSDLVNKSISRATWYGKHQQVLIDSSLEAPSGIAIDWIGRNIYWTDTGRNVIEVANMNGSFRSLVVWQSLDQPRDIVLDPKNSLMFWTQWSNHTSNIERAGMDGSYRIVLHSHNLTRPHGLAIDDDQKRIYWTDSIQARIEYSYYGNNQISIKD